MHFRLRAEDDKQFTRFANFRPNETAIEDFRVPSIPLGGDKVLSSRYLHTLRALGVNEGFNIRDSKRFAPTAHPTTMIIGTFGDPKLEIRTYDVKAIKICETHEIINECCFRCEC